MLEEYRNMRPTSIDSLTDKQPRDESTENPLNHDIFRG